MSETWNDLVIGVMNEGPKFIMTSEMTAMYEKIMRIELPQTISVSAGYLAISKEIVQRYKRGLCSTLMLRA